MRTRENKMKKSTEVLNPLEINMLLNAINGTGPNNDKEFKESWLKIPILRRLKYRFQTFCTLHIWKYFIKEENLMLPDISCIQNEKITVIKRENMKTKWNIKFYELASSFLIRCKKFSHEDNMLIKHLANDVTIVFLMDDKKRLMIGIKSTKENDNYENALCGGHFDQYFSELQYDKTQFLYFKEYYLTSNPEKNPGDLFFLLNCLAEIEEKIIKNKTLFQIGKGDVK
jgi:hypothetical protein